MIRLSLFSLIVFSRLLCFATSHQRRQRSNAGCIGTPQARTRCPVIPLVVRESSKSTSDKKKCIEAGSAPQISEPLFQKSSLGLLSRESERPFVRSSGLLHSPQSSAQISPRRIYQVVIR